MAMYKDSLVGSQSRMLKKPQRELKKAKVSALRKYNVDNERTFVRCTKSLTFFHFMKQNITRLFIRTSRLSRMIYVSNKMT